MTGRGIAAQLARVTERLVAELAPLRFAPPVTHVYNPLLYAREVHDEYERRFARKGCEAVFLGMNPGPFGMAQTGVPFGDVAMVRDWLGLAGAIGTPPVENPARRVLGFACPRREVSGTRLWGFARDRFGTPENFFARFFVLNYCPLAFMEASGRNVTPDKLTPGERARLFAICDRALAASVECLAPRMVIGVGAFAAARATEALAGSSVAIGQVLHPSPQSPAANRGWAAAVAAQLASHGIAVPPG